MGIKSYNPKDTTITVGTHTVVGFDNAQFINFEFEDDSYEHVSSADGEELRIKKNDNRATVTLNLIQGSESIEFFSNMEIADRLTDSGVLPFYLKDIKSGDIIASEACWIKKRTPYSRSNSKEPVAVVLSVKSPDTKYFRAAQSRTPTV